ncbi:ephrin type-B receptor 2-like [Dendronephthya gigantea]|uniref:ephrin type-B receptor 2-like n=1 Tax=Dendronephthya gigantea TaxID=151771 RepID=UPI00106B68D4|nr:ephrin type-B receptor 2-like [Dendronephthya gigantea]XP_028394327.1 ephrin type-B receptor 2-like [Dendronephthya gigantea]XP_028394328.1 ephrin type-B receptor 2-like [Dendronephthya gigantea]
MVLSLVASICFCLSLFQVTSSQEVIKDATLKKFWFKKAYLVNGTGQAFQYEKKKYGYHTCAGGEELELWLLTKTLTSNQSLPDVKLYIEIESQMEECEVQNGVCFKDGFELFKYNGTGEPEIQVDTKATGDKKEKQKAKAFFDEHFTFLGNITGNTTSMDRVNTTFTLNFKEFRDITFGIKSRGGCGSVIRIKVYYYICEETFIKSVMFKKTLSPQNGTKVVFGNCSLNSRRSSHMGDLKAYCYSNGSWSTEKNISCLCDRGYEPTEDHGCSPCKSGRYKKEVSNEKCMPCPENTLDNRTTCICKSGYYNHPKDFDSKMPSRCYAPIKLDEEPIVKVINDRSNRVNITWVPPVNNSGVIETVFYDIFCFVCNKTICNKSCAELTYTPKQYNLTETHTVVSGLVEGMTYEFRIYPKNSLNKVIPRDKWTFVASKPFPFESTVESKEKGDNNRLTFVVIIVCVGCLTLLLVAFLFAFCLRKRKEKSGLFQGLLAGGVELPTTGRKMYVDPSNYDKPEDAICEFAEEIDASLLYLEMLIGGGEFGDVYKGSMSVEDGKKIPVAVKTLKKDATAKSEKDFLLEASVMGQFDCANVVKLVGVVTKYRPWMIVIEFMSNGSLDNFLKANDGRLSHIELVTMAKGVAVGMEYLAGMNFVHRDLAARNVLVDGSLICKVSDFGLSRELEATDSSRGEYATTGGKIPIRWTAPEATKYRKFSSASDVWSFGILLWEIMSFAERPYWEWDNFRVMEEVDNGFRLPAPLNCPKGIHDLMLQCWKAERIERPNFTELNVVLDGWIQLPKTMEGEVDLSAALREWLESIKMGEYASSFISAGYHRPCELYEIKEDALKEMGISLVGHRNKILKGIRNLQGKKKGGKQPLKKEISLEV